MHGTKIQDAPGPNNIPPLNAAGILRVQAILGALLFYARDADNKLIIAFSDLGQKQALATEATNYAINQLLDYVATYPSGGITFRASDMVLSAHFNAAYLNVRKARSLAGTHIMLSEDVPYPATMDLLSPVPKS